MVLLKITRKENNKMYKSIRISEEDYQALKKILHKKEFNSVIETINYLVNKELRGE